jgi:hypothetical protein
MPSKQPCSQFNQNNSTKTTQPNQLNQNSPARKKRPNHQPQSTSRNTTQQKHNSAAKQSYSSKNAPAEPKDRPTRTMLCSATATGKLKMFALTGQNNRQPNQLPIQQTSLASNSGRENIRARPVPNQP